MSKVSVVIPVFNSAPYIAKLAKCLLEQTMESIEFIFVNDYSTDDSLKRLLNVIEEYPNRKVKIINNNKNVGSASSRNCGLDVATGDYVMFADSDDWMEPDMVECLYKEISGRGLNIVYSDYYESYSDKEVLINQDFGEDSQGCIYSMLSHGMHGSTCNKIYLRQFLLHVGERFVDGADLFEDVGWNIRLFASTDKIGYLPMAFYHYVQYNQSSIIHDTISQKNRMRVMQRILNIQVATDVLEAKGVMTPKLLKASNEMKLLAKTCLLNKHPFSWKRWMVTFPEADSTVWKSRQFTLNLKLLLWLLSKRCTMLYYLQKAITSKLKSCYDGK